MTDRAGILARGLGTRMRASDPSAALTEAQRQAADAGLKPMMPVAGRPFLDYLLDDLAEAGLRRVALVVAPEHDALRAHLDTSPRAGLTVSLIVQPAPLGTANAVLSVEDWTRGQQFLVMNADNLYPVDALRALTALDAPGLPVFERDDLVQSSNIPPERVRAFALLTVGDDGCLDSIVEKPDAGLVARAGAKALVSMNVWSFDGRIFSACRDVPRSTRGEFELPEAVALAIARGMRIKALPARGPVLDLSTRGDAAEVARRLAERAGPGRDRSP